MGRPLNMAAASNYYESCESEGFTEENGILQCIAGKMESGNSYLSRNINVFFLVYAASLVFFMQAGFAMICSGCVRKSNVQNTMLKNLLDACGSALAYYSVGYGFAYGGDPDTKSFIGNSHFFLSDRGEDYESYYGTWVFQFAFAATSATIVAGTIAERCKMTAYLMYSLFLTGFVYPVVARSVWSPSGFLSYLASDPLLGMGMVDFAGSGVVHVTGGVTAIIATKILGPRRGRFWDQTTNEKLEVPKAFPGHSKSMQMLGTFILWFGWYGFNAGSAVNTHDLNPLIVEAVIVNTTLSAATSGVTALVTNLFITERRTGEAIYNLTYAMNGCLSGLVAITAGCAIVEPWAAIVIGAVAGWLYLLTSNVILRFYLDDAVDAIPVHFSAGAWGLLSVGLFATERGMKNLIDNNDNPPHIGWVYEWARGSGDGTLLACQVIGLLFIIGWVSGLMIPFFLLLKCFGQLRVDSVEEQVGLDIAFSQHAETTTAGSVGVSEGALPEVSSHSSKFSHS